MVSYPIRKNTIYTIDCFTSSALSQARNPRMRSPAPSGVKQLEYNYCSQSDSYALWGFPAVESICRAIPCTKPSGRVMRTTQTPMCMQLCEEVNVGLLHTLVDDPEMLLV